MAYSSLRIDMDTLILLRETLNDIHGKYLLSINSNDFILDLFGEPDMKVEIRNNSVNNKLVKDSKGYELLYYN